MTLMALSIVAAAGLLAGHGAAQTTLTASYTSFLQTMDGFGVSQAFGRASEFEDMKAEPRRKGLDYLFNTTTGAGLTIIRNRVGSGGTGDSILPTSPGCATCAPKYVWDGDDSGQVWFSKMAKEYGVATVYADAWSAPGFMKTNGQEINGGWLCGTTGHSCGSGDWRQAFADMLVQYVRYYEEEGITVTHLGFLNEPDYTTSYSSMRSDGREAASFLPTLYDTVASSNLSHKPVLTCCDAMGWSSQSGMTSQLLSAGSDKHVGVITSHTYSSEATSQFNTNGLPTWITEACDLQSRWCTTWFAGGGQCEGLTWAGKLATAIINAGLSAYIYWEGVEVNQFQAASYLVASDGTEVIPSGRLWAFAMWSRFVRPGARRLTATGSLSGVTWGAFKNVDGSVAAVFTNTGGGAQSAKLSVTGFAPDKAEAWITNNEKAVGAYDVSLSGESVTVAVPARSVVTVRLTSEAL